MIRLWILFLALCLALPACTGEWMSDAIYQAGKNKEYKP